MRKPIVAIDVDGVIFRSGDVWLDWCNAMFDKRLTPADVNYDYNLCNHFGKSAIDFWSTPDLYGKLPLVNGAKECIEKLYKDGWEVGFVSVSKKGHLESKCDRLKELFPFLSFICITKEKEYVRADVVVDDLISNLNKQPIERTCIHFNTQWKQPCLQERSILWVAQDWEAVYNICSAVKEKYK